MIDVQNLCLTLTGAAGAVNVLNGVSFTVDDGESVALLGPSGSGKTSLLMLIAGLERATAGIVRVADDDLGAMSEDALARFRARTMGIVFQSFHLVPTMTALENVAIPLELAGRDDAFDRARDRLAEVGLAARLSHYPGELSGGEQQRVALARAFALGPRLLLADEPTGNLDRATGETVIRLLFDLATDNGTTLFLVTHDEALAERCGRLLRLSDGRITDDQRNAA